MILADMPRSHLRLEFFYLNDGFFLYVNREANPVAGIEPLEQRRCIDLIAHRHWIHKTVNRAVINHDLIRIRYGCDDFSFTGNRPASSRLALMVCFMIRLLR